MAFHVMLRSRIFSLSHAITRMYDIPQASSSSNNGIDISVVARYNTDATNCDNNSTTNHEGNQQSIKSISRIDDPFHGISHQSFPPDVIKKLLAPVNSQDVEIKPDGQIYLPEIMYRRILHESFGPGGWGLMPRGDTQHYQNESEGAQLVAREYALYCHGRFVAQSLGEHVYYSKNNLQFGKACESAKSNALMRCCKDLGVASQLWDPKFVSQWRRECALDVWCENQRTKEKKKLWRKKSSKDPFPYPWKEMNK